MVEGCLFGLYQVQSLIENPSGSSYAVSGRNLLKQIERVCQMDSQVNVGDIATMNQVALDIAQ